MGWGVENGDISGGNFFMNSHTLPRSKNQNSKCSTNKGVEMLRTYMKWKILDYSLVFIFMLCYLDTHFINIPIRNAIIIINLPSWWMVTFQHKKNSSVSTVTSTYSTLRKEEICSIQNPIHEKIKYSYLSKSQTRAACRENDVTKTQMKLLFHKT